jgi:hypothetical protein
MSGDTLTVLRSLRGVLTKRITQTANGYRIEPFSAGAWYSARSMPVASFADMAATLPSVSAVPYLAVVRGKLLQHVDPSRCRRLCDRAKHGEAVTFEAALRQWIALDIDGVPEPDYFTFAAEPEAGVEHVLELLPPEFADTSCWWQATGSAGIKPGTRCRLWFWLSRPVSDAEAKGWLRGYPVDPSLYTPVTLHYTAAPILAPGVRDPMIRRTGIRRGLADTVEVPDVLPKFHAVAAAAPVALDGAEPTEADLAALAAAVRRSPVARAIWTGRRTYPDRSRAHYALAAALARTGCRDHDTLHRALVAYDQRHGRDLSKILRPDYAARTLAAALAAGAC